VGGENFWFSFFNFAWKKKVRRKILEVLETNRGWIGEKKN